MCTPNLSSCTFCSSAAEENMGVPPELLVGSGKNFKVANATGFHAAWGITAPLAPGKTHCVFLVHPENQYCSPAVTGYPRRWLRTVGRVPSAGLLVPLTVPLIGVYPVIAKSEKSPVFSRTDGTETLP